MKRKQIKKWLSSCFFSAILAGELLVVVDIVRVFNGTAMSLKNFIIMLVMLTLLVQFFPGLQLQHRKVATVVFTSLISVPLLIGSICWYCVSRDVVYQNVDNGKAALYADKTVMLLVPHQDDDINVLGGVIEEYVKYGSEVTVVFTTNGDYFGLAETRVQEAINVLSYIGIPKEHILFLGYGDQWDSAGPHLYNGKANQVITSAFGRTETYGTTVARAYREGAAYTIDNFLSDIENVILEYRPDIIYCIDYDYHIDHRALSHSFEKVMGKILKLEDGYVPLVLKGYAYNTAWEAVDDFYTENLLSTRDAFSEDYKPVPEIYRWEERVRLPVNGESLSRSIITAKQNIALSMYESQGANMYGVRVINSDKVFWHRRTDSVSYQSDIQTSSGNGKLLNDFMLLECNDLREREPYDGVWVPEATDSDKTAVMTFPEKTVMASIALYDHPDPEKNVLNARITFDDGESLETGPLDPGGAANIIPVNRTDVTSCAVTLLETEGEAGLTEIEVYPQESQWKPDFVKIMDEAGNFVYDYWINPKGTQTFRIYTPSEEMEYTVFSSNAQCSAVQNGSEIQVCCPIGKNGVISISDENGTVLDSIYVQNPGSIKRDWVSFWLKVERDVMELCFEKRIHERIFVWRLYQKVSDFIS